MEPAVPAAAAPSLLVPAAPGPLARFAALPARARLAFGAGVLLLVAVIVALAFGSRDGGYKLLYAQLSDADGGLVMERLEQLGVPYRHAEGGAILVPADRVYELRMKLGSAGLPKSSVVGYELLDKTPFGQTQGQERVAFQRAREGELVRSITSLDGVKAARVHLALPQVSGFFREQQKPSASVVLTMHPGRTLDRAQIAGIVHLVSSSVPELHPKAVSVIDSSGGLLSGEDEQLAAQGLDAKQLEYVRQVESAYLKRIVELLEPVVGRDNLRATVTAELDFSQSESTSEEFKPNQGANVNAAVRALRTEESTQPGSPVPAGVPGAATNQPPVPATAPVNGAAQPLQAAAAGAAGASARREAETRFEVDRTVRVTKSATGLVRRLNAAVVVNHRSSVDAKGKTVATPLGAEELEKLTALVQQGIGFDKDRGDSVRVINAPFRTEPAPKVEQTPLWQQPWLQDLLRAWAAPAALALVGLVVLLTMVRPAMKAMLAPPPAPAKGAQVDAVVGDAEALPPVEAPQALAPPQSDQRLKAARDLAKANPVAVATIMRGWVNGEPV